MKNKFKTSKQIKTLKQELAQFKIDYFSVINSHAHYHRYKGETSDNTKKLER